MIRVFPHNKISFFTQVLLFAQLAVIQAHCAISGLNKIRKGSLLYKTDNY